MPPVRVAKESEPLLDASAANGENPPMTVVKPFSWEYRPIPLAKEEFRIQGGQPLAGRVRVSGA